MKNKLLSLIKLQNEKGIVIILVAILLIFFLGIAALAIDFGHRHVVRNELQNSADAGALAGAQVLYTETGMVNPQANSVAENTAKFNLAQKAAVEFDDNDIERGHWSFATRIFTPNSSLDKYDITGRSAEELDLDTDFINSIRIKTRRKKTSRFFSKIFNKNDYELTATAIAYIGPVSTFTEFEVDFPIVICQESITDSNGNYSCNMGRMYNSGNNQNTATTAGWTNFSQDPCQTANPSNITLTGNPTTIKAGSGIGAVNGVQDTVFRQFEDIWRKKSNVDDENKSNVVWRGLTLPVIQCPNNIVRNCTNVIGAVSVDIVWVQRDNDKKYNDIPQQMEDWECIPKDKTEASRFDCWKSFVNHFKLANVSGPPRTDQDYEEMWQAKAFYFLPSCEINEIKGAPGGGNFNVMGKIPVLVK